MTAKAGFDPNQLRDPISGEWIDTTGVPQDLLDAARSAAEALDIAQDRADRHFGRFVEGDTSQSVATRMARELEEAQARWDEALEDVRQAAKRFNAPKSGGQMLHKTIKAAATATDEGKFTAIAACYTVDRMDEKILPGAFAKTISHWQSSGKMLPLHWDHEGDPESIIGRVDPKSMREAEEGLYVRGQLDIEQNEKARAAWRAMKNNSIGLSFGYLVKDDETIDDVKHLKEIDLFEISITPAPVNPDTRIVSMKSTNAGTDATQYAVSVSDTTNTTVFTDNTFQKDEKVKELSEEAADEVRKGYDDLEIGLLAVGVNPEAKAVDNELSDVEENVPEQQVEERTPEPPKPVEELRKVHDDLAVELTTRGILPEPQKEPEAVDEPDVISPDEMEGAKSGGLKAVWTTAYVNDLPDSAFLYVESGEKDGKTTPRSERHFPVKDASGKVDLPHMANALARIPQSNLSQEVKDRCTAKAQRVLDDAKGIEDARGQETPESKPVAQDPLRKAGDALMVELTTRGITPVEPPKVEEKPKEDPIPMRDLRKRSYDLLLESLIGSRRTSE